MRRLLGLTAIISLAIMFVSCVTVERLYYRSGKSSYMIKQTAAPPANPSFGKALIYFMRPSGYAWGIHFPIYHGKELIGLSQAKSYFVYECDPGTQAFVAMAENKLGLKAELSPDKSYYVVTQAQTGKTKARIVIVPATPDSEWWDRVEGYKTSLIHTAVAPETLQEWVDAHKNQNEAVLSQIYEYLDTPEGQKYVVHIAPGDGR